MMQRFVQRFWGDIQGEELKKFVLLAMGAFCLIGSYWPLKPLKESIFINMVGSAYMPDAKRMTVLFCLPLVLLYTKLVDYISKQNLIYTFIAIYSVLGLMFAYLLADPVIGVANTVADPNRYVAWGFYLFAESYLTMMVAMFWSFVSDITTNESAKKGYGMIVFGSQSGGFLFAFIGKLLISDTSQYARRVPMIIMMAVGIFIALAGVIYALVNTVDKKYLEGEEEKKKKKVVGFFEGLMVLVTHPYVIGIFGLIFFQEMITTLMYFEFARLVEITYVEAAVRTNYLFNYSVGLQILACTFALFGTSFFHRRFGTRLCLVGFPIGLLACGILYLIWPSLTLIVAFMLMIKGLHFALNQPVKESLYVPTTRDIKYKSKAWIDMFGQRFSKYFGAQLAKWLSAVSSATQTVGSPIVGGVAMGGLILWAFLANNVGRVYDRAIKNKEVID